MHEDVWDAAVRAAAVRVREQCIWHINVVVPARTPAAGAISHAAVDRGMPCHVAVHRMITF